MRQIAAKLLRILASGELVGGVALLVIGGSVLVHGLVLRQRPAPAELPSETAAIDIWTAVTPPARLLERHRPAALPAQPEQAATPAVVSLPPTLHRVVRTGETLLAYLEDPITRRVAPYKVGDALGSARVLAIGPEHVVLGRPDGALTVRVQASGGAPVAAVRTAEPTADRLPPVEPTPFAGRVPLDAAPGPTRPPHE